MLVTMKRFLSIHFVICLVTIANGELFPGKSAGYAKQLDYPKTTPQATHAYKETRKTPTYSEATAIEKMKMQIYLTETPAKYAAAKATATPITSSTQSYGTLCKKGSVTCGRYKRDISPQEHNELEMESSSCKPCKEKASGCIYGFEKGKDGCQICNRCANPCHEVKCGAGMACVLIQIDCIKTPCKASMLRLCLPRNSS